MLNDNSEKVIGEFLLTLWRFEDRSYFSKIWAVIYWRKFPKKRLQSLLFSQETPVKAAKFLRNADNRRYFCTKYRRFRFFSADAQIS